MFCCSPHKHSLVKECPLAHQIICRIRCFATAQFFIRSARSGFRGRHAEAFEDNEDDMDAALDSMENADEEREAKEQEGAGWDG